MRNQRTIFLLGLVCLGLALLACDTGSLVAFGNATPTRTRTPRPTFTPRPSETATPADTDTPAPTDTPTKPPTATKAPVPTSRPVTRQPTPVPPPPAPSFLVTLNKSYFCQQANDPIWEVIARINRTGSSYFLGGYALAVVSGDGRVLGAHTAGTNEEVVQDFDFNCQVSGWYRYNVKYDVSEWRMQLPVTLRIVRSKTDTTPISPDFKADFGQPGRYFLEYSAPQ